MAKRCAVHQCPEREVPDRHAMCNWHWCLLTPAQRERLAACWGWKAWAVVLRETVLVVREVEARLPEPHDPW